MLYYYNFSNSEVKYFANENNKFSRQLLSLIERNKDSNNYCPTHIKVEYLNEGTIKVSSFNRNGTENYFNEDETEVSLSDIPYFAARKLQLIS